MSVKLSRRAMLRVVAGGAAATALAACQPQVVEKIVEVEKEVTKIVAGTPVVEKVVEKVVETKVVEKVITPTAAPKATPKVYIYQNSGLMQFNLQGSEPDKLKLVADYIKAQIGVEPVGIVPPAGAAATERLNLLLASGSQEIDTFYVGDWSQYRQAIIPLNDLLKQYGPNVGKGWPQDVWRGLTDSEGMIWGHPRGGGLINTEPFWVRTDLLEKLKLQMPKTLDDVDMVMKAFVEDNPKAKMVLAAVQGQVRRGLLGAFTEYGESNWLDQDGNIKPPDLQPGFKDYLTKCNEWVKKGWVFTEWIDNGGKPDELVRTGNVVMYTGWYSSITISVPLLRENVPGMYYGQAYGLTGPKGYAKTFFARNDATVVTRKAKHPDALIRFVDWVYQDVENHLVTAYGLKDTPWGWHWKDRAQDTLTINPTGGYYSEFCPAWGTGLQNRFLPDDPRSVEHNQWLRKYYFDYSGGKIPFDYGVPYDANILRTEIPGLNDINRVKNEEVVKYVMGVKPLSEFADYISLLDKAGMPAWIKAYTKQYKAFKG